MRLQTISAVLILAGNGCGYTEEDVTREGVCELETRVAKDWVEPIDSNDYQVREHVYVYSRQGSKPRQSCVTRLC